MDNLSQSLPELDLSHAYLDWDLSHIAHGYVCEMMADKETNYVKEFGLDSMKVSRVVSSKKGAHIWFTIDGANAVHIWFRRLVLENVMLY
jgi:hypothetical protein